MPQAMRFALSPLSPLSAREQTESYHHFFPFAPDERTGDNQVGKEPAKIAQLRTSYFFCDDYWMSDAFSQRSDLTAIRRMVTEYRRQIGAPNTPLFETPQGDGSPYVEVSDAYYFIVEERGIELNRQKTVEVDELLFWIFDGVTLSMSSDFELRNRKPGEDSRRQLFAKQEALLGQLSARWRERKLEEHRLILTRHPFNDALG